MLFKYSETEINEIRTEQGNIHAYDVLVQMLKIAGKENCRYPTIKYAKSVDESWEEFSKCFDEKYEKVYANKLRVKYKNGNEAYRVK